MRCLAGNQQPWQSLVALPERRSGAVTQRAEDPFSLLFFCICRPPPREELHGKTNAHHQQPDQNYPGLHNPDGSRLRKPDRGLNVAQRQH
ncbi:hypothetical protein D3C75_639820 [compost metagenome]